VKIQVAQSHDCRTYVQLPAENSKVDSSKFIRTQSLLGSFTVKSSLWPLLPSAKELYAVNYVFTVKLLICDKSHKSLVPRE